VPGFKKLRFRSHENVGFGPINLPDLELHTVAAYWTLSAAVLTHVVDPGRRAAAALAVGHALHHGAAMLLMCDVHDLGHAVAASPGRGAAGQWAPVVGGRGRVSQEVLAQASATALRLPLRQHARRGRPGDAGARARGRPCSSR
jgi:DEAD/DEAH box helicase domain-containing protein